MLFFLLGELSSMRQISLIYKIIKCDPYNIYLFSARYGYGRLWGQYNCLIGGLHDCLKKKSANYVISQSIEWINHITLDWRNP